MNNKKLVSENCQMLTVKQVKEYLGLGTTSTYNLFRSYDFPSVMIGRQLLVRKEAFFEWIKSKESSPVLEG